MRDVQAQAQGAGFVVTWVAGVKQQPVLVYVVDWVTRALDRAGRAREIGWGSSARGRHAIGTYRRILINKVVIESPRWQPAIHHPRFRRLRPISRWGPDEPDGI